MPLLIRVGVSVGLWVLALILLVWAAALLSCSAGPCPQGDGAEVTNQAPLKLPSEPLLPTPVKTVHHCILTGLQPDGMHGLHIKEMLLSQCVFDTCGWLDTTPFDGTTRSHCIYLGPAAFPVAAWGTLSRKTPNGCFVLRGCGNETHCVSLAGTTGAYCGRHGGQRAALFWCCDDPS